MTLDVAVSRYFDEVNHTLADAVDLQRRINVVLDCVGKGKLLREIDTATIADAIRRRRKYPGRTPAPATVNRDLIDHTLRPLLNRARKVWGARSLPAIDWRARYAALPLSEGGTVAWTKALDEKTSPPKLHRFPPESSPDRLQLG